MADFNTPSLSDSYTNILAYLKNRDLDIMKWLDSTQTSPSNVPQYSKRWNRSSKIIEEYDGSSWASVGTWGISITGSAGSVPWSGVTSTPTTLAGYGITDAQPLDSDLTAVAALSTTGIVVRTGSGTMATRSMGAPAAGITWSNADGVSGNPTIALANDLSALEGLASTGIAVRTGTDAWAQRTITGTTNKITVTNGDGVSGNPTLNIGSDVVTLTDSQTLTNKLHTNPDNTSQTLTDGANIDWNMNSGHIASVTLAGNRNMNAPTNLKKGVYILHVLQDGTGGRTLTWNSVFKWVQAIAPVLTTTANRRDIISFVCDGTNLYGSFLPDVR
jgi:hypothetical protein